MKKISSILTVIGLIILLEIVLAWVMGLKPETYWSAVVFICLFGGWFIKKHAV